MEQYIPKAAVLAEIDRRLELLDNAPAVNIKEFAEIIGAQYYELINLAKYINTLEVKEVDLEEEVDKKLEEYDWEFNKIDFYKFAQHFFELGLNARKEK